MKKTLLVAVVGLFALPLSAEMKLPPASTQPALAAPHFPSRLHAFVWRNWECFPADRLGSVVGATAEQIRQIGHAMGLPDWPVMDPARQRRNYISVIRRNWHLLNYEQLLKLLGWTPDQLATTLREDDFLWHKLGALKPACEVIQYGPADTGVEAREKEIHDTVARVTQGMPPPEPRFSFVEEFTHADSSLPKPSPNQDGPERPLRFLYSYCAVYGDPLLNPDLDPYPDGLLQRLAQVGVNGVWMHVVLRDLAPSNAFPEFGVRHQERLKNLARLVERCGRYGIRVYLYMNEPRSMPDEFFQNRADIRGNREGEFVTMCTSAEPVRRWLTDSLAYVFERVPQLGGVFTITASENLTNCCSHFQQAGCPRCSKRPLADVISEVNRAIAEGVHRGSPKAKVIMWDWGWPNEHAQAIIGGLPTDGYLMSVSEWDQPFTRGGVSSQVGEYSISVVGPGPRAKRHWEWARARGLKTVAKIQANCTWEISALPYLPAMELVGRHCEGLRDAKVDGLMLSWTLGGYPSPNLQLVQRLFDFPKMTSRQALSDIATERFGQACRDEMLSTWTLCSKAFEEFPYNGGLLYEGPQQLGPANLLYPEPTHYRATMVGFPYDGLLAWCGPYPPEAFATQFEKLSKGWNKGVSLPGKEHSAMNKAVLADTRLGRAAGIHFASTANQIRYYMARGTLLSGKATSTEQLAARDRMREIVHAESQLAQELLQLTARDSRIGYEASNHYYYLPTDLLEKVVSCDWIAMAPR